jgi:hypothetical protein
MSRTSSTFVWVSVAAVFLAFAAFFMLRDDQPRERTTAAAERLIVARPPVVDAEPPTQPTTPTRIPQATSLARAAVPHDGRVLDEPALMATLRDLRGSNPELTLRLAREGNQRFKASAETGERSWFIVKSLSDLGRHDEARVEGRALVDKYWGTRWAEDVYRHLFVNPPTHPFERGYGQALEVEP